MRSLRWLCALALVFSCPMLAVAADQSVSLAQYLTSQAFGGHRPDSARCSAVGSERYTCLLTFGRSVLEFDVRVRDGHTVDAQPSVRQEALCRQAQRDTAVIVAAQAEAKHAGQAFAALVATYGSHPPRGRLHAVVAQHVAAVVRSTARLRAAHLAGAWGKGFQRAVVVAQARYVAAGRSFLAGRSDLVAFVRAFRTADAALERARQGVPCVPR
jgi:hypothetical protein